MRKKEILWPRQRTLIRRITLYPSLPLINPTGEAAPACLARLTSLCVCVCVCVYLTIALHASLSVHLASILSPCLSPCLVNHASFMLSVSLSIGVCMCVSMGEMTTGFPAVLTTCSTPSSFASGPPLDSTWLLYLDHPCCPVWPAFVCSFEWLHYSTFFFLRVSPAESPHGAQWGAPAGESGAFWIQVLQGNKIKCKVVYNTLKLGSVCCEFPSPLMNSFDNSCNIQPVTYSYMREDNDLETTAQWAENA